MRLIGIPETDVPHDFRACTVEDCDECQALVDYGLVIACDQCDRPESQNKTYNWMLTIDGEVICDKCVPICRSEIFR